MRFSHLIIGLVLSGTAVSHPGHDICQEITERREFINSVERSSLAHCAEKLKVRGNDGRNIERRSAKIAEIREKRGLKKRDLETVLGTSHDHTDEGYTMRTDAATLFAGNNSCVLTPEVAVGPFYVAGERIRHNLVEDQEGVPLFLDYQLIDVETCDPIPGLFLEMWHCNATGIYSGVISENNGDPSDQSIMDETWLRGIQRTDREGVAQFVSIFPGHYVPRATHIHILVHTNVTLYSNRTLGHDVYASHTGQIYFDQDLISEVESIEPYRSNTKVVTQNSEDLLLTLESSTDGDDPLMEYAMLGDSISDGLFAWLSFGINTTHSTSVVPGSYLYASGGVDNPDYEFNPEAEVEGLQGTTSSGAAPGEEPTST
ncbi:Intradiol ring-cleavage dioxygenase [Dactylonectria macrodidyma]|uniref:Intradiol ring-cleavage dioxygenase n=1 Tax=Dactylonectria macrodidyma TaxID=307937 RepID=A0A9P9FSN9_9HYPO|nr:Intradiol ring-cleavage dioxygenase [Dactylonectria macrodidyma]